MVFITAIIHSICPPLTMVLLHIPFSSGSLTFTWCLRRHQWPQGNLEAFIDWTKCIFFPVYLVFVAHQLSWPVYSRKATIWSSLCHKFELSVPQFLLTSASTVSVTFAPGTTCGKDRQTKQQIQIYHSYLLVAPPSTDLMLKTRRHFISLWSLTQLTVLEKELDSIAVFHVVWKTSAMNTTRSNWVLSL